MRARYYDPSTAQFVSRDPIVSITRDAYGYAASSPLTYADPSGLFPSVMGTIKAVNKVSGYVAAGAGTLALISSATGVGLPVGAALGTIAVTAGAVAAGTGIALAYSGQKSWSSAAVDTALGGFGGGAKLATRGVGKVAEACTDVPPLIYRAGGKTANNFTARSIDDGSLSFRSSISNPIGSSGRPVFRPGDNVHAIDTNLLPKGSVVTDNNPAGHVSVSGVDSDTLLSAIVSTQKMPK